VPTTAVRIERRSLSLGKWANLLMGIVGVAAALVSRSDALLVDGLYSALNFVSAIVAARIGAAVVRPPDRRRPFGYDAAEPLYVTFRSLVLMGIIVFAAVSAVDKIIIYASGGSVPELVFGPIVVYTVFMVALCGGLAYWHHFNWRRSGSQSAILETESRAALIDGAISAGTGGALAAVPLLRGTALEGLIPIADAVVVLVLELVLIRQPIAIFRAALREVAGGSAEAPAVEAVRQMTREHLDALPLELLEVAVTPMGRNYFAVAYLHPDGPVEASMIDALREKLERAWSARLGAVKAELIITAEHPFD